MNTERRYYSHYTSDDALDGSTPVARAGIDPDIPTSKHCPVRQFPILVDSRHPRSDRLADFRGARILDVGGAGAVPPGCWPAVPERGDRSRLSPGSVAIVRVLTERLGLAIGSPSSLVMETAMPFPIGHSTAPTETAP